MTEDFPIQKVEVSKSFVEKAIETYSADRLFLHQALRGVFSWDNRLWVCTAFDGSATFAECEQVSTVETFMHDGDLQITVAQNKLNLLCRAGTRMGVDGKDEQFIIIGTKIMFVVKGAFQ